MITFESKTVREIALTHPITTRVFEEFKIDYCCHGNVAFTNACESSGADPEKVRRRINDMLNAPDHSGSDSFSMMDLSSLIDHINDTHHVYTKAEMSQLTPLMAKVASRHGNHMPCLFELKALFQSLCEDLGPHMMKEEMMLFPYVQKLEYNHTNRMNPAYPPFGTVQHPVKMMEVEHETVGDILVQMRAVTNEYKLPAEACPSFTALYHRLAALELDLHQHIHLENNLLFPRAVEMEQQLFSETVH